MSFRKPKQNPEFADLNGILAQSKQTENPVYQTVQEIINRLTQFKAVILEAIHNATFDAQGRLKFATRFASFLTENDESTTLPNSRQLIAGNGITLDVSIANEMTITASGAGYAPVSTGAEPLEIMSDGAGSVLMVGFSE